MIGQAVASVRCDWVYLACMYVTPVYERPRYEWGTPEARTLYEGPLTKPWRCAGGALATQEHTQTYNSYGRLEFVGVRPIIII